MGRIADIALHVKGKQEKFIEAQKAYFKALEKSAEELWCNSMDIVYLDTLHDTKKDYRRFGEYIWQELAFKPKGDDMYGNIFWDEVKWAGYFKHQCDILLEVFSTCDYSWYYIHVGESDDLVVFANNSDIITGKFDEDVFKPYTIEHCGRRPIFKRKV